MSHAIHAAPRGTQLVRAHCTARVPMGEQSLSCLFRVESVGGYMIVDPTEDPWTPKSRGGQTEDQAREAIRAHCCDAGHPVEVVEAHTATWVPCDAEQPKR